MAAATATKPAKAVEPLEGKASANAKQAKLAEAKPVEHERRHERVIDGVRYELVNGGWARALDQTGIEKG